MFYTYKLHVLQHFEAKNYTAHIMCKFLNVGE